MNYRLTIQILNGEELVYPYLMTWERSMKVLKMFRSELSSKLAREGIDGSITKVTIEEVSE